MKNTPPKLLEKFKRDIREGQLHVRHNWERIIKEATAKRSALAAQRKDIMNWVCALEEQVNHELSEQQVRFGQMSQPVREQVYYVQQAFQSEDRNGHGIARNCIPGPA
jgi:hypothetical protein